MTINNTIRKLLGKNIYADENGRVINENLLSKETKRTALYLIVICTCALLLFHFRINDLIISHITEALLRSKQEHKESTKPEPQDANLQRMYRQIVKDSDYDPVKEKQEEIRNNIAKIKNKSQNSDVMLNNLVTAINENNVFEIYDMYCENGKYSIYNDIFTICGGPMARGSYIHISDAMLEAGNNCNIDVRTEINRFDNVTKRNAQLYRVTYSRNEINQMETITQSIKKKIKSKRQK